MSEAPETPINRVQTRTWSIGLFAFLAAVYLGNGDYLPGNDARSNIYLSVAVLDYGSLSFDPGQFPSIFQWRYRGTPPAGSAESRSLGELIRTGEVEVDQPDYYLTKGAGDDVYVDSYGVGAGLSALPVFAALKLAGHDAASDRTAAWYGGKVAAALLVAGSAVFVFLGALPFCTRRAALLLGLAYGLGTGVWSTSSQTLWQHGPNEFFLALGAWLLIRSQEGTDRSALWCGAALAAAVFCRPTSLVVVVAVGLYFAVTDRRALGRFVMGGLPLAILLVTYNEHYLGSAWAFGQTAAWETGTALARTGQPGLWQTSLWEGALGLLVSPSRGLFVFSPFLLFLWPSCANLFRDRRCRVLIPLAAASLALMVVAFKWFDWWGGWCYGCRPLVDTMPMLTLLLAPTIGTRLGQRPWRRLFAASVAWSIALQLVGAFSYDLMGWNARPFTPPLYEATLPDRSTRRFAAAGDQAALARARRLGAVGVTEVRQDVDRPEFRGRLWSVTDSEVLYYALHFTQSRRNKEAMIASDLQRK